jgi:hypothetical protein
MDKSKNPVILRIKELLNRFSWNLIMEDFTNICIHTEIFVATEQNYWTCISVKILSIIHYIFMTIKKFLHRERALQRKLKHILCRIHLFCTCCSFQDSWIRTVTDWVHFLTCIFTTILHFSKPTAYKIDHRWWLTIDYDAKEKSCGLLQASNTNTETHKSVYPAAAMLKCIYCKQ